MKKRTVADIMTRDVVTLSPKETIHEAAARLAERRISGAPVVDDGRLVGVISEADLMRTAIRPASIGKARTSTMALLGLFLRGQATHPTEDVTVGSVMTSSVVTAAPTTGIWEAASKMEREGFKRLPVVDGDDLVGIISRADLVAAVARTDTQLRDDVLEAIAIAGEDSVERVEVEVHRGVVALTGITDRRTTKSLVLKLAARVPGILEVVDHLGFESDDTREIPREKDPWAVGPLVKHG